MTLPNFLVIGAGRSGTTSLHHYLGAHPDVFVPAVKSPSYFFCVDRPEDDDPYLRYVSRNYLVRDRAAYEALFDGVRGERAIGEISPAYLATIHAAPRIAERLPRVRLIAVLRNPVDRAFARFVARRRDGLERRADFAQVVRDEQREGLIRDDAAGTYVPAGFVSHVLATYLSRFPRERIRLHLFEDLVADPLALLRDLYTFLGVDPDFVPDMSRRHNESRGIVRGALLRRVWTGSALLRARVRPYMPVRLRQRVFGLVTKDLVRVSLDPSLRAELTELYRPEIERLAAQLNRDLSHWLERPVGA